MTSLLQGLGAESGICKQWYDVQTKATFDFFFLIAMEYTRNTLPPSFNEKVAFPITFPITSNHISNHIYLA